MLRPGDVILSVNGKTVANAADAGASCRRSRRAASRSSCVWRGDDEVFVTVKKVSQLSVRLQIGDRDPIERGPLTVAAFMDLALYDPELGYYARAAQRSGRAGDFFTSVDVGPLFGELLESSSPRCARRCSAKRRRIRRSISWKPAPATVGCPPTSCAPRSARDPCFTTPSACTSSKPARRRAPRSATTLADVAERLVVVVGTALPDSFEGVLVANELLDAMPVHQVVMREDGLREVYVAQSRDAATAT